MASASARRGEAERRRCRQRDETEKWEKITYAGIVTCTVLSIYNLSRNHSRHPEAPPFEYLHVRNKEFPWGPDDLFEKKHAEH